MSPKEKNRILIGSLVAAFLCMVGFLIYLMIPKPIEIAVTGTSPSATPLVKNATYDPVYIRFSGSAAKLADVGKAVTSGITMTPQLTGTWRWRSDRELAFQPTEDWGVGQRYTVEMDPALFPDHVRLATHSYDFSSAPFTHSLVKSEFYQDPQNPRIKRVVAEVRFSHPVDEASLKERVFLRMGKKKDKGFLGIGEESFPFAITYDEFHGRAYIVSEPVRLPADDTMMEVKVEEGVVSSRGGDGTRNALSAAVRIPGVYNFFRITSARPTLVRNEQHEPEQVLVIELTDGVLASKLTEELQVYLLPDDRPPLPGSTQKIIRNYHWGNVAEIGPEVLEKSRRLLMTPIPTERDHASLLSYHFKAPPNKYLYVRIPKGLESRGGYVLAKEYDTIQRVPRYPKEVEVLHDGALLSMTGSRKLSILTRGVEAVRLELGRVLPDQLNHLVTQTGGDLGSPRFNNYRFSQDNITERIEEIRTLGSASPEKAQYTAVDFTRYLKDGERRGLFFLTVESWDPKNKRSTGVRDKRFVLITDLGLVIKDNQDGSHEVFIQSLRSGKPVPDASVEVLGKNGLRVARATTDRGGRASFPDLKDFKREKTPVVYLARSGRDLSFIPFSRGERRLNLSRFDVGGVHTARSADTLSAYLFSDRGIYRPGDIFKVGLIVKAPDWSKDITGIPLEAVVTDPRGMVLKRERFKLPEYGFGEVSYRTDQTSPTGTYQVTVYVIKDERRSSQLGTTTVKVEEFLPDRMKIDTRFSKLSEEGWVSPDGLKGRVTLKNLFGIPAADRRVTASISLSPARAWFRPYKDYVFFDPMRAKRSFSERLGDGKTDGEGLAEFDFNLGRFEAATYRLNFTAEGFEAGGGRGVVGQAGILVSPRAYMVGYKADGKLNYLKKNAERNVDLIAIGPDLKKMEVSGLTVKQVETRYVSTLVKQNSGLYKYQSVKKETTLSEESLTISAEGSKRRLSTEEPGDFSLVITDGNGTELSRIRYSVVGEANLTRSMEKNAELSIRLNKTDFSPGEEIEVSITAPYTGAGLITIERDRVYADRWFSTGTTSAVRTIKIPNDLEGNGYVNVTFVRAADSPEIFASPLSYGVQPFTVSKSRRDMQVQLSTGDIARPGEPFPIRFSSKKKGKIVVYAVNEGILQVAKYQTPAPLEHFFRKRALEVSTSQILDLILPEFELLQRVSATGGGDRAREAVGKNLNPFQRKRHAPVAFWSGIIDTDGEERQVVYDVPGHFSGTLRVMAVAVGADAVGSASRKAIVRGHYTLSPNVPTFVAPGDTFVVTVSVANNVEGSGKGAAIDLSFKPSQHLEAIDGNTRALKVDEGREATATFKLRATDMLGGAEIDFTAKGGGKTSRYRSSLSVRPPMPFMTTVGGGHFEDGKRTVNTPRRMYPHFRTLEAAASTLPLTLAGGLEKFLVRFPYGCTEQLVSKAMPAVVLAHRPELGGSPKKANDNLTEAVHILRARQNSEGAFGYWTANSHVSGILSIYAMHFLTEAKQRGHAVPGDLMDKGINYLRKVARSSPDDPHSYRERAYAIYVMTLNGIVTTSELAQLEKQLEDAHKDLFKSDIIGPYLAATHQLLRQKGEAKRLIKRFRVTDPARTDYRYYYDRLTRDAQYLYILSRHFPEYLKQVKGETLLAITGQLERQNYNTLSSALTILALDAYATAVGTPAAAADLGILALLPSDRTKELPVPPNLFPTVNFPEEADAVRFTADADVPVFYQITQAGYDLHLPDKEIKEGLEVQREYRNEQGKVVTSAALGEELSVHLKLRAVGDKNLTNVAAVDLLPGGFEVVLDSVRGAAGTTWQGPTEGGGNRWRPDYVDAREDRVVVFGTVGRDAREYIYRIKATNRGTYQTPPTYAESMYDRKVVGRSPGAAMTVGERE